METKFVGDFGSVHSILEIVSRALKTGLGTAYWKILLVCEDKEKSIAELILVQHALQFFSGFDNTISIVGVDDEDDTLGVLVVVAPKWSDLVLTTNVPHGELNVLVLYGLNVEA